MVPHNTVTSVLDDICFVTEEMNDVKVKKIACKNGEYI
jgi:hypothetical protein